jgi:hypothetical protein
MRLNSTVTRPRFTSRLPIGLVLLATASLPLGAQSGTLATTFDTDLGGWTTSGGVAVYRASGGNPGGYLFVDNSEQDVVLAAAPQKFRGDLRAYSGGTLSFDGNMLQRGPDPPNRFWTDQEAAAYGGNYGTVTIRGAGLVARKDLEPREPPLQSWKHYSTPFTAAAFGVSEANWTSILTNVTGITVSLEAIYGQEMQGFDNFVLQGGCATAPGGRSGVNRQADGCLVDRPVPEVVVIDAIRAKRNGFITTEGREDVLISGPRGFKERWKATTATKTKIVLARSEGPSPSTVALQVAGDLAQSTEETLTWTFSDGNTYQTRVVINVQEQRPIEFCPHISYSFAGKFGIWQYSTPPVIKTDDNTTWFKADRVANPNLSLSLGITYKFTKDLNALPDGNFKARVLDPSGTTICEDTAVKPAPPPPIPITKSVRFDVYASDQNSLFEEITVHNPGSTVLSVSTAPSNQGSWAEVLGDSYSINPGESREITVFVRPATLRAQPGVVAGQPTSLSTVLTFSAPGYSDARKLSSPRRRHKRSLCGIRQAPHSASKPGSSMTSD